MPFRRFQRLVNCFVLTIVVSPLGRPQHRSAVDDKMDETHNEEVALVQPLSNRGFPSSKSWFVFPSPIGLSLEFTTRSQLYSRRIRRVQRLINSINSKRFTIESTKLNRGVKYRSWFQANHEEFSKMSTTTKDV